MSFEIDEEAIEMGNGFGGDIQDSTPHRLSEVAARYSESIEHKSLAPDGSKCAKDTRGLLRPRPIRASGRFHWIGKEVDRGSSLDPEFLSQDELKSYGKQKGSDFHYEFPGSLRKLSIRDLAKLTGISKNSILKFKNGGHPSAPCEKKLRVVAEGIAKRKLNLLEAKPGPKAKSKNTTGCTESQLAKHSLTSTGVDTLDLSMGET